MQGGIINSHDTGLLLGWDREERWASLTQLQQTFWSNPKDLVINRRGFLLIISNQKILEVYKVVFISLWILFVKINLCLGKLWHLSPLIQALARCPCYTFPGLAANSLSLQEELDRPLLYCQAGCASRYHPQECS